MSDWRSDKKWSDRFIPAIKQAVGPLLLTPASLELDCYQATDLIVLVGRDMKIAARVRAFRYFNAYPDDFTIRSQRDNGTKTELRKIQSGWADWMFYGFATSDDSGLLAWRVLDLNVFRDHIACVLVAGRGIPGKRRDNGDGTRFQAFAVADFPAGLVVAQAGFGSETTSRITMAAAHQQKAIAPTTGGKQMSLDMPLLTPGDGAVA